MGGVGVQISPGTLNKKALLSFDNKAFLFSY